MVTTGAQALEISGKETGNKADLLASKLNEAPPEQVRISYPMKCTDLSISGLDDSVSSEDLPNTVVVTGGTSVAPNGKTPTNYSCSNKLFQFLP